MSSRAGDTVGDGMDAQGDGDGRAQSNALVDEQVAPDARAEPHRSEALVIAPSRNARNRQTRAVTYAQPMPGRTWRMLGRVSVLVGGSAVIGIGVASGGVSVAGAAVLALALATSQVIAQTWRQNKLGQAVVGGISLGDLAAAQKSAELALVESPSGVMRTLAASNLASVLIQTDRIDDAATLLDRYPPGLFSMPLATILWLNNRAFALLAAGDLQGKAGALLTDAEARLAKANPRDLGGPVNAKKLTAAVCGTRAIERVTNKDGQAALTHLHRAREIDDGPSTTYRTVERELCRAAALRLVGRKDEAVIGLEALNGVTMTARQTVRWQALQKTLGL